MGAREPHGGTVRRNMMMVSLWILRRHSMVVVMDTAAVTDAQFDALVDRAMARLPAALRDHMDNVALFVADDPPPEEPDLLGVYDGVSLPERNADYGFTPPDTISLFKNNLVAMCADEDELERQVYITIVHEIAHHFGVDEARLHELGWG